MVPGRNDTYTALLRQKEVMTIFIFLRYGTNTKFCLIQYLTKSSDYLMFRYVNLRFLTL